MTANASKDVGVFTGIVLSALRYPPEPADPEGSAQSIRVVSISPRYLAYRVVKLWVRLLAAFAVEESLLHATLKGPVPELSPRLSSIACTSRSSASPSRVDCGFALHATVVCAGWSTQAASFA